MPSSYDWMFWTAGGLLGALALWLLYWSLFHDWLRNRRKRRCPKCWYDLSGTPGNLTCSECGFTARREKKLHRARRRWRLAAAASLILLLALPLVWVPKGIRDGWVTVVPTTALVLLAPRTDQVRMTNPQFAGFAGGAMTPAWDERIYLELVRRADADKLWSWQWRWLTWRHWRDNDPPWTFKLHTRHAWPEGEQAYECPVLVRSDRNYLGLTSRSLRFRFVRARPAFETVYVLHPWASGAAQPTDPWQDRAIPSGSTSGDTNHSFQLIVERLTNDKFDPQWQRIWSGRATLAIIHDDRSAVLPAADPDPELTQLVQKAMTFRVEADAVNIRWSRSQPELGERALPTVAVRLELQCDDKTVATARAWWTTEMKDEANALGPVAIPFHYRVMWEQPVSEEMRRASRAGEWRLRVSGDRSLALRDVRSQSYWAGSFDAPLHWEMKNRNWIDWQ